VFAARYLLQPTVILFAEQSLCKIKEFLLQYRRSFINTMWYFDGEKNEI
jgi:hypothetical protein